MREHDGADYEPVVFARTYGVSRVVCAVFGILLLLSAGVVTTTVLWPQARHSTWTLPFTSAVYLYGDDSEDENKRLSAQGRVYKFTDEGIRVIRALRDDELFGDDAQAHLEEIARALKDPTSIHTEPIHEPFRDVARFLLDRGNDREARRDALRSIANQTRTGIEVLFETEPPTPRATEHLAEIERKLRRRLSEDLKSSLRATSTRLVHPNNHE